MQGRIRPSSKDNGVRREDGRIDLVQVAQEMPRSTLVESLLKVRPLQERCQGECRVWESLHIMLR